MELNIQTPALLFPAVSLLLLAYTNKYLAIANLIRKLHSKWEENRDNNIYHQISSLRRRVGLIRWMQVFGVASMLGCVVTMFFIYAGFPIVAKILFAICLILLILSLCISITETMLSAGALNLQLKDMERQCKSDDKKA